MNSSIRFDFDFVDETIIILYDMQLIFRKGEIIEEFMSRQHLFITQPKIRIATIHYIEYKTYSFIEFVKEYFDIESQQKVYDVIYENLLYKLDIIGILNHRNITKSSRNI